MNKIRGIAVVASALAIEDFPATKQDLYYSVGDLEVENKDGSYIPVRKVLDRVSQAEFTSADEAIKAIQSNAA